MKIEIIRFSPGWWLWLPGLSKQLDLRAADERPSKEEFKAQVQLRGPRLNVARPAAGSIHHLAPDWVSRVRRAAREGTTVSGCICSGSPWRRQKPQNSSKSAKKRKIPGFASCHRKATRTTELFIKTKKTRRCWIKFLLCFKSKHLFAENYASRSRDLPPGFF